MGEEWTPLCSSPGLCSSSTLCPGDVQPTPADVPAPASATCLHDAGTAASAASLPPCTGNQEQVPGYDTLYFASKAG